ncbi:MAG: ABC-F family ATP-binding cassette domain-containing protein [Deltaproteobacteria bacterium]
MNYLQLENVSKTYGEKILLDDISLNINKGDKIGLVAKNGSGKSTLLRLIAGLESPEGEKAKIIINKNIKLAILEQEPVFYGKQSLVDTIFDTDEIKISTIKEYEEALLKNDSEKINSAVSKMDNLKCWDIEARIKEILFKLKIPQIDKKIEELSGGHIKRLALAKILLAEPEFLVLDEPTNHLDVDMIEWLEEYLQSKNMTVFMVTHDRYFLENTCNRIVELENGKLFIYSGNYENYLEKKSERIYNDNISGEKLKKLYKKELEWLNRQPKARGTKSKARIDKFYEIKERTENNIYNDPISIDIETQRLGSKILELYNVQKSYEGIRILNDFTYKFRKNEKTGIIGNNGVGKTTFINMLVGSVKPDNGRIITGETVKFSIFSQHSTVLNHDKKVIEVIHDIAEYLPLSNGKKLTAEQLLEKFLFSRSQQQIFVSQLSGGEKRRLQLLSVLMTNPNFLILDEPTNDLDIITLNVLEEYLIGFKGNLIIITHDRYFMDKISDHIFIMDGRGEIKIFNGTCTQYRLSIKELKKTESIAIPKIEDKNLARAEKKKLNNEISRIQREIEIKEAEKSELIDFFSKNSETDLKIIEKKGKHLKEVSEYIKQLELKWEATVDKLEKLESEPQ